jgi:diacylglycerol kinase (ATP)
MKSAKLLHNPKAGEGQLSKEDLVAMIEDAGFDCSYSSTKDEGWEKLKEGKIDFVILGGGDGTVRKVAEQFLEKKVIDKKFPIGLLPLGTANNIAKTLGIEGSTEYIIHQWTNENIRKYDIGKILNYKKAKFFLEGIGFGIFPELMQSHSREDSQNQNPQDALKSALTTLLEVITNSEPTNCRVVADKEEWEGEYILVEIMNTSSIGPNLQLAPNANPGDGELDIVMIAENQRDELITYVKQKLSGKAAHNFQTIRAKKISVEWAGKYLHVDDQLIKMDAPQKIEIEIVEGLLEFLV